MGDLVKDFAEQNDVLNRLLVLSNPNGTGVWEHDQKLTLKVNVT